MTSGVSGNPVLARSSSLPCSLNLLQTSIKELSGLLEDGTITSVDLVKAYIANIERNNLNGLCLRAIIQVAPRDSVLEIAKALDDERRHKGARGPLHGIPILVKDCIATDPELGMCTSAGNTALHQSVVPGDAIAIKGLRDAGAIILAKSNLTEFSQWKGEGGPTGWSAVLGQTQTAYVKGGFAGGGSSGGSSSGNAVGLRAGFGATAIGNETAGSIMYPSSRAALYAIRTTNGLISSDGIVPISRDAIGPMGFTSEDVAIVLDAMTEHSGKYVAAAHSPRMNGLRLGLVGKNFRDEADGRWTFPDTHSVDAPGHALDVAVEVMRCAGADVLDVNMQINYADCQILTKNELIMWSSDFKKDLTDYLVQLKESPVRSIAAIAKWNEEHALIELPPNAPSQSRLIDAINAPGRQSDAYRDAQATSAEIAKTRGLDYMFDKYDLDAAVFAMDLGNPSTFVAAAGYASGIAPLGYFDNGSPFGILFVVRPNNEEKLISIL